MYTARQQDRIAHEHIPAWLKSTDTQLWHVYGKYSPAKNDSYIRIQEECMYRHGWHLRIISHNSMVYTAGYVYTNPETGVLTFVYHTPYYRMETEDWTGIENIPTI